jgi:CheY-like chemotaxis protein
MSRRTVMVVDDDADIRSSLRELLEDEGFVVTTAEDGNSALQQLESGPLPSLILLDLMMRGMNGWQFVERQQATPAIAAIPVVVLSANQGELRGLKVAGYVRKPFKVTALLEELEKFFSA